MTNLDSVTQVSDEEIIVGDLSADCDESGERDVENIVQSSCKILWEPPPLLKCVHIYHALF